MSTDISDGEKKTPAFAEQTVFLSSMESHDLDLALMPVVLEAQGAAEECRSGEGPAPDTKSPAPTPSGRIEGRVFPPLLTKDSFITTYFSNIKLFVYTYMYSSQTHTSIRIIVEFIVSICSVLAKHNIHD